MTPTPDPRVKERFLQAIELSATERAESLARMAAEDAELARQVQALLVAHDADAAAELERVPGAIEALLGGPRRAAGLRLGDYELVEEVGSGAFGAVWRARQRSLGRTVAVKVLRGGALLTPRGLERLRAEAGAVARLDHPHIVPVHEVASHEGVAFFSMKWIEGGTLAQRLDQPWPTRPAVRLLVDVARAVHHAHQRGLLHRDLKPSNILLDEDGRPHVADFGIAKRLDDDPGASTTQALAGTPAYMAPEQAEGGELTVATDVWALGCVLYELLAGRPAFAGDSVSEVLRRIRQEEPVPLRTVRPDVPRDLETIVLVCLRKEGARRYASADALADDLERWLAHEPIAARRTGALERLVLFGRRSPLTASLIGLAAGLVLLLAVVATWASVELGARLRDSYLEAARATRLSGAVGGRNTGLDLLSRAAAIRPGEDLRDEAIACLALTDLVRERTLARESDFAGRMLVDGDLRRIALQEGGSLCVVDVESGAESRAEGVRAGLDLVRWSSDGRWIVGRYPASADPPRAAGFLVWDADSLAEVLERPESLSSRAAEVAPDGTRLAYGTSTGDLAVLELPAGVERARIALPRDSRAVALAHDAGGTRLAVGVTEEEGDRLLVVSATSLEVEREVELPDLVYGLCWTGDGRRLAVACGDFRIHLYDAATLAPDVVCQGHSAEVIEVFADPGSPLLLSNSWDETARVWDATTGTEIRRLSARALGFARQGSRLLVADARSFGVWRIEHDRFLRTVTAHSGKSPRDVSFAPDGRRIASAGPDGVFTWDLRAGTRPRPVVATNARAVRFTGDGGALLVASDEGLLRIDLAAEAGPRRLLDGALWGVELTADGRTAAVQGRAEVRLVDPLDGRVRRTLRGGPNLDYLAMSADGTRVAAGNWRGRGVHLWSLNESGTPRILLPDQDNVSAALSPDGELLATVRSECFELWRAGTGERLLRVERWRAFGNAPAPAVFSPVGDRVAFALSSEVVRLIDTRTRTSLATLEPPRLEAIFELAFSPDGSILGSACSTNRVQLWDLAALEHELSALGLSAR